MEKNIWIGSFQTFEQAKDHAQQSLENFENDIWISRIINQLQDYKINYSSFGVAAAPPRPCGLPNLISLTAAKSILDFGGSSGWCWEFVNNSVSKNSIEKYTVLENKTVSDLYTSGKLHHDKRVECISDFQDVPIVDILYVNSVLQYLPSNDFLLKIIDKTRASFILLEDVVALHNQTEFFSLQHYYGKYIPYRFLNFEKLKNELHGKGFDIISVTPYISPIKGKSDIMPMSNFPKKKRVHHSLSILCKIRCYS